jgi:hypothetical protein
MDPNTLIKVVALIDRAIENRQQVLDLTEIEYEFSKGYIAGLSELSMHLEIAIDAAVAAMESNTGE